jgi:hypothetical protein
MRTGDILRGLVNRLGGVKWIFYELKCAGRDRSLLRIGICTYQIRGLMLGRAKAMMQTW